MTTKPSVRAGVAIDTAITAMNACIQRAETEFADLHLNVPATVLFPESNPLRWLRFGKYQNAWILQVHHEDDTRTPLANTDLKTRRAALALLPQLHTALIASAEDTARSINLAVADATTFLDSLSKGGLAVARTSLRDQ
jgi:hypothetical protein